MISFHCIFRFAKQRAMAAADKPHNQTDVIIPTLENPLQSAARPKVVTSSFPDQPNH
jgi:hypothetical protein